MHGSDHQLLESIDGLRDAGWLVTLCLPASGSLVELVRGSDVQRVPFAVLCKALLGLLPLLRPALIQLFIEVQLFFEGPWLPAAIRPG